MQTALDLLRADPNVPDAFKQALPSTDLSVIVEMLNGATQTLREANDEADQRLVDQRARAVASYEFDAYSGADDEWASFDDTASAECLLEIYRALKLPDHEFKMIAEKAIVKLIERNAETNADILERR